jgi:hypothetical protein
MTHGMFLPMPEESITALKTGIFKEAHHYLPQRISLHNLTPKPNLQLELEGGQVLLKERSGSSRRVTSFDELSQAHYDGILRILSELGDQHRVQQYTKLWDAVRTMQRDNFPFEVVYFHYEITRRLHPGVTDCVGEFHQQIHFQTQQRLVAANMDRAAHVSSTHRASSSSAASPAGATAGKGRRVCIPYNDLKCQDPCPRNLPHVCCRCFQQHASMSGECSMPDPRQAPGYAPRGKRGSGAGGKSSR